MTPEERDLQILSIEVDKEFNEEWERVTEEAVERRRKRSKNKEIDCFWMGMALCLSLGGLMGDIVGLEGYIKMAEARWIDIPWPLWLPVIALILWAYHKTKQGNE